MGNTLGGKRTAKIMKMDGQTFKLKTPLQAGEAVKNYPGFVLLDSEAVKQHGVRAKPLEPYQNLDPKRLYFLVEPPKKGPESTKTAPRRVRSGINMSAKERLESLMLLRRTVSDISAVRPTNAASEECESGGAMRVRMRLPKAEVERVMRESKDEAEAAEKIMELCTANANAGMTEKGGVGARERKRVSFLTQPMEEREKQ